MGSKFYIATYGCQMNKHDSELISGVLTASGYSEAEIPEEAEIIIFNTCSVRKKAEDRVFSHLSIMKNLKINDHNRIFVVAGCMAERDAEEIKTRAPHVNLIFGPEYINELPFIIDEIKDRKDIVVKVGFSVDQRLDTDINKIKRISPFSAWVTIMRGCDNFCSYCIVPYVRGREWSRSSIDIIDEIKKLVDNGIVEVTLLGQNVNSYKDKDIDFPKLLKNVNEITGLKRIRFVTSHPKDFSKTLIDVMTDCENVCEQINLPAQSGSDRILKLMNRKYRTKEYLEKIEYLKMKIPQIAITTDIIVGFPGETEDDFSNTLDLIDKVEFDGIFGFIYSERPGTSATNFEDNVPREVKVERLQRVITLQRKYGLQNNSKLTGKITEVLIEGTSKKNDKILSGRTKTNKIVNFEGDNQKVGSFVNVLINGFGPNSLKGLLIKRDHHE
jgi:tRNA-2-methylthio-N6-dimethylallyladenosine synthase